MTLVPRERVPLLAALAVVVLASGLALVSLFTFPASLPVDAAPSAFSGGRALAAMAGLADRPHPIHSQAKLAVRDGIAARLRGYGLKPVIDDTSAFAPLKRAGGDVSNLHVLIPGSSGAGGPGPALFLAHYDSVPYGPGANDNASGCAILLETARLIHLEALQGRGPVRDLVFLWTDGEEYGELGAEGYLQGAARRPDVVINVDTAKDTPLFIIGGMEDNGDILAALAKSGVDIRGYSWIAPIAGSMAVDSDYSPFGRAGVPGVTLGDIALFSEYHTSMDAFAVANPGALQSAGDLMVGLARGLGASADRDFRGPPSTYFSLAPKAFVHFPTAIVPSLTLGLVALALLGLGLALRGKLLELRDLAAGSAWVLLALAGAAALGFGLATLANLVRPDYRFPRYANRFPGDWSWAAAVALSALAWSRAVTARARRKAGGLMRLQAGLLAALTAGAVGLSLALPSASYLCLFPGAACALAMLARRIWPRAGIIASLLLGGLSTALLFLPVAAVLFTGLGVKSIAFLTPVLTLVLLSWSPALEGATPPTFRPAAALGLAATVAAIASLALVGFSPACPRPTNLAYAYNADTDRAALFVLGGASTDWQRRATASSGMEGRSDFPLASVFPFDPIVPSEAFPADRFRLAPPSLSVVDRRQEGGDWIVEVEIGLPGPGGLLLAIPASVPLRAVESGSGSCPAAALLTDPPRGDKAGKRFQLVYYPAGQDLRLGFRLEGKPGGPQPALPLTLASWADSLPEGFPLPPLPEDTVHGNDAAMAVISYQL
jgi:hypothetical protein